MRTKITAATMATCVSEHICQDVQEAFDGVVYVLDEYDLPAPVVMNLQGAKRALETANHHMAAASLIATCQAEKEAQS